MADQWVRDFSVTDPQRHTKGFTVYRVSSTVFPRKSPEAKTDVVVWKRFSEFQKLHKDLKSRHEKLYLNDTFPCFSKPHPLGRFDPNVIEERRLAAQTLLDFIAKHPPLFTSESCVRFFEKSHRVVNDGGVLPDNQQNKLLLSTSLLPTTSLECDLSDTTSQSSIQSTITDTDSTISVVSSPSQMEESVNHENCAEPDPLALIQSSSNPTNNIPSVEVLEDNNHPENLDDLNRSATTVAFSLHCIGNGKEMHHFSVSEQNYNRSQISSQQKSTDISPQDSPDPGKSVSQKYLFPSSMVVDYITRAGYHVSQAVEFEAKCQFECAFASYKAAISSLLNGIQDDPSEDRRSLVQRKASQYLLRAEQIYHEHLDMSHNTTSSIPEAADIPSDQISIGTHSWKSLESPITDLKIYKVLGIVSTVILSLNTCNDSPYIIKVLHKSSCPVDRRTKSIIPCNVPFMCHLHTFMENDCAVFLILEQARGGRLWDYVRPYFEHHSNTESPKIGIMEFLSERTHDNEDKKLCDNGNSADDENLENSQPGKCASPNLPCLGIKTSSNMGENEQLEFSHQRSGEDISVMRHFSQNLPDVVRQKASAETDVTSLSIVDASIVLNSEGCHRNSKTCSKGTETDDILRSSQKLLESVNNTLSKSEEATQALLLAVDETLRDCQQKGLCDPVSTSRASNKNNNVLCDSSKSERFRCPSKERILLGARDRKRSASRDRKPSTSRRPRSRIRFSCDDMFEGRARALSRSLDREALHRVDPRVDKSFCPGLPTDAVRLWAAQLLLALDALHRWGVIIGDLRPDNLLLGCGLNLKLTYQCHWVCVDRVIHAEAIEELYAAPEVGSIQMLTAAADWWSYGAILFELLSGETLYSCHPGGFHCYSNLYIPTSVCEDGANLLRQLLKFDAHSRLGVGPHGVAKLKAHSFFREIEWSKILLMSVSV